MKNKLFLSMIVALMVVFSTTLVLADSELVLTPISNHIRLGQEAQFNLNITNTNGVTKSYKAYSLELGWMIDPPPADRIFDLNPGESKSLLIKVKPLEPFNPGAYAPSVYIDEYDDDNYVTHTESLKLYLSPEGPVNYLPSLKVKIDMVDNINPKEPLAVKLFLENANPLNLSNLKLNVKSEMVEFNQEFDIDLAPLGKKTIEFTIVPNEFQQPKDYTIFFVFENEGQSVKLVEQKVTVDVMKLLFITSVSEEKAFFKIFREVRIVNDGNVINSQQVKTPVSFFESIFSSSADGKVVKDEDGQRNMVWEVNLAPNESTSRNFVINYRILLYLTIIALIFAVFYFYVKSPVSVKKTATITKSGDDGTMSEIKVTLEVKNKSKRPIKDVEVVDTIPGIANIKKSLDLGTLKPKDVITTNKGTKVTWSLAEIDAFEHRLITYKVKAKLNIVGTFILPRAVFEFPKKRGKKGKAYSNVFRLG